MSACGSHPRKGQCWRAHLASPDSACFSQDAMRMLRIHTLHSTCDLDWGLPASLGGARCGGGKVVDRLQGRCRGGPKGGAGGFLCSPRSPSPRPGYTADKRSVSWLSKHNPRASLQSPSRSPTASSSRRENVEPPLIYKRICESLFARMLPESWECVCSTLRCI